MSDLNDEEPHEEKVRKAFETMTSEEFGLATPANIVVAGFTGVGKSTLINAVFGADFCKTGTGAPVTQGIDRITQADKPVVLYDTKGLEVENSQAIIANLETLLKELRANNDPALQPHAMWLCVNTDAGRFEEAHERLVALAKTLRIPLVIVLTQDYFGDSEEFSTAIQSILGKDGIIVPVVADTYVSKSGKTYQPRGIHQLIERTAEELPDGARAAFEFAQTADLERRRAKAVSVVNRTAALAAGTAFPASFLPLSHSAVLVALETHMLRAINKALGLTLKMGEARALTLGLAGIVGASVGGRALATQLASFIPGVSQIAALTVGGTVAAGVVKALGTGYTMAVADYVAKGEFHPTVDQLLDLVRDHMPSALEMIRTGRHH
jgi:uncharacterized protein (DUF697 family)